MAGQVDYFLKIAGVEGEAEDKTHGGEIAVLSWSWSESQSGAGGFGTGQGTGKVAMNDFHFVMRFCKASPVLILARATGEHFDNAVLTCRKAGKTPVEYLVIKFTKLLVSSYQTGGSDGGEPYPTDSISMNYTQIEVEYKTQKEDGSPGNPVKAGYNVKTNSVV